ncbi:hypothetical protein QOT17_015498 [Balamuthia mandrillaris]
MATIIVSALSIPLLRELGVLKSKDQTQLPPYSVHTVTVPGAAAGWVDTVAHFGSGRLALGDILQPAIQLAEEGYPVAPITAHLWSSGLTQLLNGGPNAAEMLVRDNGNDGDDKDNEEEKSKANVSLRAPRAGELMRMPELARTFRELATHGKKAFYEGRIAEAIVAALQENDNTSTMTLQDLKDHLLTSEEQQLVKPVSVEYEGVRVWELPPNGQGIVALMALNLWKAIKEKEKTETEEEMEHNSVEHLHRVIESLRLAFADGNHFICDPTYYSSSNNNEDDASYEQVLQILLSEEYAKERVERYFSSEKASTEIQRGHPENSSCTVYLAVVDEQGNACSFINSNYMGFGTGIIPKGCGFTLHNRGHNFSMLEGHPNALAPRKRPYHTIIPGMATRIPPKGQQKEELFCCFGVMGAFMQPQGHLQVLLNMIDFKMDPQQALDAPRCCILATTSISQQGEETTTSRVALEEGISERVIKGLKQKGHTVEERKDEEGEEGRSYVISGNERSLFGRGQIILAKKEREGRWVMWGGSDPRGDGLAIARC